MISKFQNKTVIITGACDGIGKATAIRFSQEGARVILLCRDKIGPQKDKTLNGSNFFFVKANVNNVTELSKAIQTAINKFGPIDYMINNAGIQGVYSLGKINKSNWQKVINTNLKSVIFACKSISEHMIKQGKGVIINVASQAGIEGEAFNSLYVSSKFAVVGFSQSIALELAAHGIRVNSVCPGPVETKLLYQGIEELAKYHKTETLLFQEQLLKKVPLKRFAQPDEIAGAIVFLCSSDATFITGASLLISGGMTLH